MREQGTKVVVRFRVIGSGELRPVRATLVDGRPVGSFRWVSERIAELSDGQLARFESVRTIEPRHQ